MNVYPANPPNIDLSIKKPVAEQLAVDISEEMNARIAADNVLNNAIVAIIDALAEPVDYATTAGTADYATTAGTAGNAETAGTADYATTAGTAGNAETAGTADYATTAGTAGNAETAGTADYATTAGNADYATTAGTADYATTAGTAGTATTAGTADYATTAGTADYAVEAGTAGNAETADYATTAGTADYAVTTDYAIDADKWKTARNISISDADGTNTGTAVSVDGSENETLKLPATIKANVTGNASTATLATQANAIKPRGNSITLPAVPTSVTKTIKIASVDYLWAGNIKISAYGGGIAEDISLRLGQRADIKGLQVTYSRYATVRGIDKVIVTRDGAEGGAPRNIYIEFTTFPNYPQPIVLGVVETNSGTFTPSMTEVSSVEGIVLDDLSLSYQRGEISSYQHVFTKNIIGNLTGNASTASTADKIPFATKTGTSTGTQGQASFDDSYLYLCTATNVWKRVELTSF